MDYYFYDRKGFPVYLSIGQKANVYPAAHVLVFAITEDGKIILTKHKNRGWEIPGGKVEPGESPLEAAHRELLEETGVKVKDLTFLGQYIIEQGNHEPRIIKNVYQGVVTEIGEIPKGYETECCGCFSLGLQPFTKEFSPFIQDHVFPLCARHIKIPSI